MIRTLSTVLLFAAITTAADVSGKWTAQVPARGESALATFSFKVDSDKLTGSVTSPQGEAAIQEGKVTGDQISFSATGGNAKIVFQGTVSGNEIRMTRTREGGQAREFTLKRVP